MQTYTSEAPALPEDNEATPQVQKTFGAITVKFQKLRDTATTPTKGHSTDACYDLYTDLNGLTQDTLAPGQVKKFGTGLAMEIPEGYWGKIHVRSSLGVKGVDVLAGVIDAGYRGEVVVVLVNNDHSAGAIRFNQGDRIAQIELKRVEPVNFVEVDQVSSNTTRGSDGFGSTGR